MPEQYEWWITNESYAVHPITLLSSIATGVKGCAGVKLEGNLYILISNVFYEYFNNKHMCTWNLFYLRIKYM